MFLANDGFPRQQYGIMTAFSRVAVHPVVTGSSSELVFKGK